MPVTFDGPNLRIILDATEPQVDVEADIYSEWKEWMKLGDNSKYPLAFRTVGGDALTPGIDAGAYFFIRNDLGWRIRPDEADQTYLVAGNLAPQDSSLPILIPTIGDFSVLVSGLQPITQSVAGLLTLLEFSSFNSGVTVDTINGIAGTAFPIGTPQQPVSNLTDALSIANSRGLTQLFIIGDLTIGSGPSLGGKVLVGESPSRTTITIDSAADVLGTEFLDATITGTLDGDSRALGCLVKDVNYISGFIERCVLSGTITLGGTSDAHFLDCWTGAPGANEVTIDLGGVAGPKCIIRNLAGLVHLTNRTGNVVTSIDLASGTVDIDNTVTAGTVRVRGVGTVIDNSGGTALILNEVLDSADMILTRKLLQNRTHTDPSTGTMTVYDDDDSSVLTQASLFEDVNGATPYSGTSTRIDRRNRLT